MTDIQLNGKSTLDTPSATMSAKEKEAKLKSADENNKPPNYKRISDDDLYRHSSQYRMWSYTRDQLQEKRVDTNARAIAYIEENLLKFREAHNLTEEEIKVLEAKAIPLTMEEELDLVNFYAKKVQVIAQHLNLPTEVVATAISFFRRFFLENSVMQIDPKSIVHTTIFLACKSENYFISVDSFAQKAKSTRDSVLKFEFKLLESLKFSLLNHHPYKPLHGFFLDIQNVLYGKVDLNYMGQIYDRCKKRITAALLTDVVYFYTPPQITLATLLIEDEALVTRYLETKFPSREGSQESVPGNEKEEPQNDASTTEKNKEKSTESEEYSIDSAKLLTIIRECKSIIEDCKPPSTEEAKKIAAKNYYCQNPSTLIQKLKRKLNGEDTSSTVEKKQKT
ncbi:CFC_HP_G0015160.mRNA.1.CDS.1 [Saccharomyces cerevisiae]|nr:CFC_HP_G0006310.mRNA.1.CDS.1 [Saccharomyces cerevisiae]CAI5016405.1 CFC_HP_G0015160.mRNA.1.CDS.1 [Saccharomyces cerevisiae]CAI6921522.1 CFC_HP_G0006310.mRNA.1.CDS.1 [Saccharomyces cerevisiae]CAI6933115.1 CFC_HP_G0015160.mRNA.1.CDS.1 [Saccharomyces cerevisiae]